MTPSVLSAMLVALMLAAAPLPRSDEGQATIEAGQTWTRVIELEAAAHLTCIVRCGQPVNVSLARSGPDGLSELSTANTTGLFRSSVEASPGQYLLVVVNNGQSSVTIEYQVHQDFVVVANMTAKNVMGLSLALSIIIVALFLRWRPRHPQ